MAEAQCTGLAIRADKTMVATVLVLIDDRPSGRERQALNEMVRISNRTPDTRLLNPRT